MQGLLSEESSREFRSPEFKLGRELAFLDPKQDKEGVNP